jgi:hypothetical protein
MSVWLSQTIRSSRIALAILSPRSLPSCKNSLNDLRRQQRHAEYPADVGRVDVLGPGDFLDGGEVSSLRQSAYETRAGRFAAAGCPK